MAYGLSFFLPLLANNIALAVHYHGQYYFPMSRIPPRSEFGQAAFGDPDYRALKAAVRIRGNRELGADAAIPYGPNESLLDLPGSPPQSAIGRILSAPTIAAAMCSCAWPTASTSR
jgi:ABC-type microcin C transport system permease subunit YejE